MVPNLRERYLAERNSRIAAMLTNPKRTQTERFWDAMEKMEHESRVLQDCLDGHSRSKMQFYMMQMISVGMLRKEDMSVFSEELQNQLSFLFGESKG